MEQPAASLHAAAHIAIAQGCGVVLQGRIDREVALAREFGGAWAAGYDKDILRLQVAPDRLEVIKIGWTLESLILRWQDNRNLLPHQLLLRYNSGQYTSTIVRG